ncbi:hypothetical protein MRX96_010042 [Rhipicephalus microplus]
MSQEESAAPEQRTTFGGDVYKQVYYQLLVTNLWEPDPIEKPFPWQAQPKRVLKLELTDGTLRMQAIEFEPVPCMSADMRPGIKLLITGPVECRRGVMFLRADNVRVLGGMVESLLEGNSREAVLCRVLGRDLAQVLDGVPRPLTADRPERDREDTNDRQSINDRTA